MLNCCKRPMTAAVLTWPHIKMAAFDDMAQIPDSPVRLNVFDSGNGREVHSVDNIAAARFVRCSRRGCRPEMVKPSVPVLDPVDKFLYELNASQIGCSPSGFTACGRALTPLTMHRSRRGLGYWAKPGLRRDFSVSSSRWPVRSPRGSLQPRPVSTPAKNTSNRARVA